MRQPIEVTRRSTSSLKRSGQYLSTAGEPSDRQKVVAAGSPYAWYVEDEESVDSGVRYVEFRFHVEFLCALTTNVTINLESAWVV